MSAGKRTAGWRTQQRREDRIRTAAIGKGDRLNIFNMTLIGGLCLIRFWNRYYLKEKLKQSPPWLMITKRG
ncbi:MAG: hypothetical protein M1351_06680 [Candidatus Thermoplasmatota archaeon]|nr:hypothetical protein [Candidatus Sysuiplasma jiujiangense]MBX8639236.1 hypothetical protein [Candidatus Sysuiplasma jiujiangense]MBX8642498.1 hypothetical protein [Candidatus Sysuiplasma jiujiangense]MCL5253754.1 hypothetical protein [Candidatus Thermoplasmatota archaeon]